MSNVFFPNFKSRIPRINKRFRSASLSENGYKNTGRTKVGEWYDWLQQGIVSLIGTGAGTNFLNKYCSELGFEEEWFHLRKKNQQILLNTIIKEANTKSAEFISKLRDSFSLTSDQIDELYKRLNTMDELLEHDLSYTAGNIHFESSIGPYGITLNDPMKLIGTNKKYDPIINILWYGVPKNPTLNVQEFKDLIYGKFDVLINFGGDARLISLNQAALDTLNYKLKKVYYSPKALDFIKKNSANIYKLISKNIPDVNTNEYRRIYKRKEVSIEEDQRLSTYICGVLQEYTIKTGKSVPIVFWYFSKSNNTDMKKRDNVYFLGTSRDKNRNRFVFVFQTNDLSNVNIVNDSIELFQILAIDIPLKFLEQANIEVTFNDEELEVVDEVFVEPVVQEMEQQYIIEPEDYEEDEEEIPLLTLALKKRNNVPEPPKPQEETGSLSRQFRNLDLERYGRGQRRKK